MGKGRVQWSEQQLAAHQAKIGKAAPPAPATIGIQPAAPSTSLERYHELGRKPAGQMNKTEAAYAQVLEMRRLAGEIVAFKFEAVTLRLAVRTRYKPDFLVKLANGDTEIHEVKGFWKDDARVKIKVAAELYRDFYRFIAITKPKRKGGNSEWLKEQF
jgi:hypothetical protein